MIQVDRCGSKVSSRLWARFVRHDTAEENMKLLRSYLEKFGRPVAF